MKKINFSHILIHVPYILKSPFLCIFASLVGVFNAYFYTTLYLLPFTVSIVSTPTFYLETTDEHQFLPQQKYFLADNITSIVFF